MNISLSCESTDINWATLPDLQSRLTRLGLKIRSVDVELSRYPETIELDSFEDAANDVKENGSPASFIITVYGLLQDKEFCLRISRGRNIHNKRYLHVDVDRLNNARDVLNSVIQFFNFKPDKPSTLPPRPQRTAFIGHRFDAMGTDAADKLARLLELIGFRVVTGRAYSPKSIAEKVSARIEEQATVFVILTPGSDDTWLIQESVLSAVKGKPLIILKDTSVNFKSGILADMEYIPFTVPNIEACFNPILEGLRDLGYFDTSS